MFIVKLASGRWKKKAKSYEPSVPLLPELIPVYKTPCKG